MRRVFFLLFLLSLRCGFNAKLVLLEHSDFAAVTVPPDLIDFCSNHYSRYVRLLPQSENMDEKGAFS